jgi:hypothetical protein
MRKYLRATVGIKPDRDLKERVREASCCIHMLSSIRPMSLGEIIEAHQDYDTQFAENFGYKPSEIEQGLESLISLGLVRVCE